MTAEAKSAPRNEGTKRESRLNHSENFVVVVVRVALSLNSYKFVQVPPEAFFFVLKYCTVISFTPNDQVGLRIQLEIRILKRYNVTFIRNFCN